MYKNARLNMYIFDSYCILQGAQLNSILVKRFIAAVISIGVAMISGFRPARKATKIEVMQALRQEL